MNDFNESDLSSTQLDLIDLSKQEIDRENLLDDTVNNPTTATNHVSMASTMSTRGGFCIKEHEEQLETLQKENFNLKLRIYFLEKNHPNLSEDAESLFSQNIDFKVQIETLAKERDEQRELLMQASKALELMEYEKNQENGSLLHAIESLEEKILSLETDNYSLQQAISEANNKTNLGNDTGYAEFQGAIDAKAAEKDRQLIEMGQRVEELQHQLTAMSAMKDESAALNQKLTEQVSDLQYENAELGDQVHTTQSTADELNSNLEKELHEYKEKWAASQCDLHDALQNYEEKEEERKNTFKFLQATLQKLEESKEKVHELESQITNKSSLDKGDAKKDYEIDALKQEVNKFKVKIQEATTNELQEKNREIERLTELLNSLKSTERLSIASEPPRFSFDYLYETFNDLKYQQAMEIKKQSQQKIDQLVTELATMSMSKSQSEQIEKLKRQMEIVIEKQEYTDGALTKCSELCSYTLDHLNELTQFLAQLLQNKDIRESLSEGSLRNIQGILEKSMEFAGKQSIANTSNLPLIDFLVNVARQSISHYRDIQTTIRKNDKSIQTAANALCDNKCEDDMATMMENFEELKRVNQVLEDEIVELKNSMAVYEKQSGQYKAVICDLKSENHDLDDKISELQKSIDALETYQDEMIEKYHNQCVELQDAKKELIAANEEVTNKTKSIKDYVENLKKTTECLQECETKNNKLTGDLEESQGIITSLELAKVKYETKWLKSDEIAKKLEKRLDSIDYDLKKNWITKQAHESLTRSLQEEIVNAEAQVAAIRMETEKIKSDIHKRKSTLTSQNEHDDDCDKENATHRRTIEISDDRKQMLMSSMEAPCNYCEHYKNKAIELKKNLQLAVDELQKNRKDKIRTDLNIKKQINETESFMQQIRGNLEGVNKNLNQRLPPKE